MLFKDDQKLTIISISEFLACTQRREIRITRTVNGRAAYQVKGKRKEYYFDINPETLVFDGWSLPLVIDTDTLSFAGNGMYNFLIQASLQDLITFLTTNNINERFNRWADITYDLYNLRGEPLPVFTINELKLLDHGNYNDLRS